MAPAKVAIAGSTIQLQVSWPPGPSGGAPTDEPLSESVPTELGTLIRTMFPTTLDSSATFRFMLATAAVKIHSAECHVVATCRIVRDVAAEFGLLTATEVGERLGSSSKAARNLASARHRSGELLAIRRGNRLKYPGFQFGPDGSPNPAIRILRTLSQRHNWAESDLFLWLATPAGRLHDARPIDVLISGTVEAQNEVVRAAELEMSAEW